jgi:FMN phosphatase YigB (HAD superfamily)
MKRFHQLFLLTQFLLVASIVVTSLAPVQAEVSQEEENQECSQHEKEITKELKVHLDYYYELLAEKFAPAEIEKWKEIRSERDLLQKKLKEAKQRGELQNGDAIDKVWLDRHRELHDLFNAAVEKRDKEQLGKLIPKIFEHYGMLNNVYKERLNLDN